MMSHYMGAITWDVGRIKSIGIAILGTGLVGDGEMQLGKEESLSPFDGSIGI